MLQMVSRYMQISHSSGGQSSGGQNSDGHNASRSVSQSNDNKVKSRHIINSDSIIINKELGVGEFGVVQQGVWTNEDGERIQVAIKCLSCERLENNRIEFLKEATIMHSISHEHIVRLFGVVLEPSLMLVTELAPLRSLLECLKEPALRPQFPIISLCNFAAQVSDGMCYLESKRLIHRDLAARNILVFAKNKVKISDFGLSRALGVGKDYYQTNFNVNLKLPIAWCAPECINYLKFTSQSDVWAYGVTLWEMFSYGFQPWAALTGQQILESIDEPSYQRLEQPECCPKEYYLLMLKCWSHDPNARPKFSEIVSMLPDCKPELVQAVKDNTDSNMNTLSSPSKSKKEFLSCKVGDIITVLDKRGSIGCASSLITVGSSSSSLSSTHINDTMHYNNLWKGALNSGKTGYFNPNDCVAYLGQNLPTSSSTSLASSSSTTSSTTSTLTSTVLQSNFIRSILDSKNNSQSSSRSAYGSRRRLRPDMISRPQGDLKHTGHVGADGAFFGDVSFLDGKYHQLPKHGIPSYDNSYNAKTSIAGPSSSSSSISKKWMLTDNSIVNRNGVNCGDNHEYHEISDEDDFGNNPFETLDFGPSLVEEVFRELDHIKPDLDNEINEAEVAINESSINVKNEVREINLKINKEAAAITSKKKQAMVKPISASDQMELDSAIAMAKDIATRSMLTLDNDIDVGPINDSPKTPTSPNKRKFSFKFSSSKSSPKCERRNFSEETELIGDINEIITPAAKEAYNTLVEKGASSDKQLLDNCSPYNNSSDVDDSVDGNPLRMLRSAGIGGVLRAKVRGNRSFSQPRLPTTAQTAGLARVASTRSTLGVPPPVPNGVPNAANDENVNNALPLPPRDRSRPMLVQLKTHQRRHPLVMPTAINGESQSDDNAHKRESSPLRIVPVLKHVSCPQPPATFLSNYSTIKSNLNDNYSSAKFDSICDNNLNSNNNKKVAPIPPPKPARIYTGDESLSSEMEAALDNISLGCNLSSYSRSNTAMATNLAQSQTIPSKSENERMTTVVSDCSSSDNRVRNEDLLDLSADKSKLNIIGGRIRSIDSDEVRVMQKVLANEVLVSSEECANILHSTDWDVHRAIKCIRLREQLRSHNIMVECDWALMLAKFNWNIRQASNYLIATQGVPEDTTEV